MNKNFDRALESHFSQKHDVPEETKLALREKLYNSLDIRRGLLQHPDKLRFVWLLASCMVLAAVAVFFAVEMFFGISAAIVLGAVYYFMATIAGVAVLIFMLLAKKLQTSY